MTSKFTQSILFKKTGLFFGIFYIIGISSGKAASFDHKLFPLLLGVLILLFILDFKQRWDLKNQEENDFLKVTTQPSKHNNKTWIIGTIILYLSILIGCFIILPLLLEKVL